MVQIIESKYTLGSFSAPKNLFLKRLFSLFRLVLSVLQHDRIGLLVYTIVPQVEYLQGYSSLVPVLYLLPVYD